MKNLFIVLAVVFATGMLVSCKPTSVKQEDNVRLRNVNDDNITTISYQGHDYILLVGRGGSSICHNESCNCKKTK